MHLKQYNFRNKLNGPNAFLHLVVVVVVRTVSFIFKNESGNWYSTFYLQKLLQQ